MKVKKILAILVVISLFLGLVAGVIGTFSASNGSITVTVNVKASDGSTGLDDTTIMYKATGTTIWYTFGTTANGGIVTNDLTSGIYEFYATYEHSTSTVISQDIISNPTVDFQTSKAVVKVLDSTKKALSGVEVKYRPSDTSNWYIFGTNIDGKATKELFAGDFDFYATYQQSISTIQTWISLPGDVVIFTTNQAVVWAIDSSNTLLDGVDIMYKLYGTSNWYTFGTTSGGKAIKELFAGNFDYFATYQQSTSAIQTSISVPGAAYICQKAYLHAF